MDKTATPNKAANASIKAFNNIYQIQARTWKQMADIQMNYLNLWQEYLNSCFQRVPTAKNVSDLVAIESGLTAEYGNKFAECSKEALNALSDAQQEMMTCLEKEDLVTPMLAAAQDIWEQGERVVREAKAPARPRAKEAS